MQTAHTYNHEESKSRSGLSSFFVDYIYCYKKNRLFFKNCVLLINPLNNIVQENDPLRFS